MKQAWLSRCGRGLIAAAAVLSWAGSAIAQQTAPEPPPPLEPWYEAIEFRAFVDAYSSVNWGFPKPQTGPNAVTRAYDVSNGFALSWVGVDASYAPDPVGGTISLRLGPTASIYAGPDAAHDLQYVKQAFVSWAPFDALTLDFGKFNTIFGAEVAESQDNINYTRGVVYWFGQPLFHTGLRANWALMDELSLNAMVVNGWNNSVDNNVGKSFALQAVLQPAESLGIAAGWIGGPEQDDLAIVSCDADTAYSAEAGDCDAAPGTPAADYTVDRGGANNFDAWRHLFDLVVTFDATEQLKLVLNGNYGVEGVREGANDAPVSKKWYGGMLGVRYQLDETWAVAARGEYYAAPDGHMANALPVEELELATGTLTIEAKPTDNLILRLEGRGDFVLGAEPDEEIFQESVRDTSDKMFTTTLGVVVTTN